MIELREYATKEFDGQAPPSHIQVSIRRQLRGRLEILWLSGNRVRVASTQWVGVVRLPDGQSIRIVPKLAGGELRVMTMLGLVGGLPSAEMDRMHRDLRTAPDGDALELLCRMMVRAASAVLTAGPLRDYRPQLDDVGFVRGRMNTRRQGLHHFGRVDVLACEFQEFDHDVLENRLICVALAKVRTASLDSETRRRALILHEEFLRLAPGPVPPPAQIRREVVYDRRNEHYRSAHVWSLALLEDALLDSPFSDAGASTTAFLIDMNALFEQFVMWLVKKCFAGGDISIRPQQRDGTVLRSDGKRWGTLIPDLLICRQDARIAVDAKYKRYDLRRISPSDVYQLLIYAQAYRGFTPHPRSILLYPTESAVQDIQIDLTPGVGQIASVVATGIELSRILRLLSTDHGRALELVASQLSAALGGLPNSLGPRNQAPRNPA